MIERSGAELVSYTAGRLARTLKQPRDVPAGEAEPEHWLNGWDQENARRV